MINYLTRKLGGSEIESTSEQENVIPSENKPPKEHANSNKMCF